jgi:hypothetical protein
MESHLARRRGCGFCGSIGMYRFDGVGFAAELPITSPSWESLLLLQTRE